MIGEWNKPDRHDKYLMKIILLLKQLFASNSKNQTIDDQKIVFDIGDGEHSEPEMTEEESVAYFQSRWAARLGITTKELLNGKRD